MHMGRKTRPWPEDRWGELLDMGLPLTVMESMGEWYYFLEHGDIPSAPWWKIEDLSRDRTTKLIAFLEREYQHDEIAARCLLLDLERHLVDLDE